jgi:hypothetical protein
VIRKRRNLVFEFFVKLLIALVLEKPLVQDFGLTSLWLFCLVRQVDGRLYRSLAITILDNDPVAVLVYVSEQLHLIVMTASLACPPSSDDVSFGVVVTTMRACHLRPTP